MVPLNHPWLVIGTWNAQHVAPWLQSTSPQHAPPFPRTSTCWCWSLPSEAIHWRKYLKDQPTNGGEPPSRDAWPSHQVGMHVSQVASGYIKRSAQRRDLAGNHRCDMGMFGGWFVDMSHLACWPIKVGGSHTKYIETGVVVWTFSYPNVW